MNVVATEVGYAIKYADGSVRGRPLQVSGGGRGWALYKTKKGAERRAKNRFGGANASVIRAKITITEEPTP